MKTNVFTLTVDTKDPKLSEELTPHGMDINVLKFTITMSKLSMYLSHLATIFYIVDGMNLNSMLHQCFSD